MKTFKGLVKNITGIAKIIRLEIGRFGRRGGSKKAAGKALYRAGINMKGTERFASQTFQP